MTYSPSRQAYLKKQKRLERTEESLKEAAVWTKLRASEHGDLLQGYLLAQINACYQRFAAETLDFSGFLALQAEVKAFIRLLTAGKQTLVQIEQWEKDVGELRNDLEKMHDRGLDRDLTRTKTTNSLRGKQ